MSRKSFFIQGRSRYGSPNKISLFYLWCFRKMQTEKSGLTIFFAQLGISLFRLLCVAIETKFVGGLRTPHLNGIFIHHNVSVGENCMIFQQVMIGVNEFQNNTKAPRLGNRVYVGAGAKLIGDISIGDNVRIGANAVVTKDVVYFVEKIFR